MPERPGPPGGEPFARRPKPLEGLSPEALTRYTVWQPRYEAFKQADVRHRANPKQNPYPRFPWMTPANLGPYLLFRLDMIDRQGGSRNEKRTREETLPPDAIRHHYAAEEMLATRLDETHNEIIVWGRQEFIDFQAARQHFGTPKSCPRTLLSPQQNVLADILQPRVVEYEAAIQATIDTEIAGILTDGGSS